MGCKSRGNYNINTCFMKDCANRNGACNSCIRTTLDDGTHYYSNYVGRQYPTAEIKRNLRKYNDKKNKDSGKD